MVCLVLGFLLIVPILHGTGLERKASVETFLLPPEIISQVQNVPSPEMRVCGYLCSRGPVTAHICYCSMWIPCLGQVCRKGSTCRILDRRSKLQTVCCPEFQSQSLAHCEQNARIVTWNRITPYFRFNPALGGCETLYWTESSVKIVHVPGHTTHDNCTTCALYGLCNGPIVRIEGQPPTPKTQRSVTLT